MRNQIENTEKNNKPAVRAKRALRMGSGQGQACIGAETTRRKSRPERSRCRTTEEALRSSTLRLHLTVGSLNGADHRRSRHPGRGTAITGDGLGRANAPSVSQLTPTPNCAERLEAPRLHPSTSSRGKAEHDQRASDFYWRHGQEPATHTSVSG